MENQAINGQITESQYADSWRRAIAFALDVLLVVLFLSLTILRPNTFSGLINIQAVVVVIALILYEGLFVYYRGTTIGKFLMGIRLVDYRTQRRPSLVKCFIRPLAKLLFGLWIINSEFIYLILLLVSAFSYLKMATDKESRAFYDKMFGMAAIKVVR